MSETITLIAKMKDELSGPINRTSSEVEDFDKKLKLAAAAAVAAGIALLALANKYGQLGAQIRDTAAGLDVSTDTLQALNYQFIQTGGGAETFSVAMRGLTSFMRTAATGGSEQVRILNDLGMSYEQIAALRPQDQFYAVTEALEAMTNGQKQAEAASALFGSRYSQRVLGTLRQTEGTLEDASRAFADADLGISEQDVMALAEFSDKMTLMKQQTDAMMAEALLPIIDVLGRVTDNFKPIAAIVMGFTTAVLLNTGALQSWGTSMVQSLAKLTMLKGGVASLKTGLLGTAGLGAAITVATYAVYELSTAMHDAQQANLGLADNLQETADLLQNAIATGFMSTEEAAAALADAYDSLTISAQLDGLEQAVLESKLNELYHTLSTTTINADLYIESLAGVSKGSYEAAIAQAQLQRAFAAGVFGADFSVVEQMDGVIASLRGMRDEAIRSGIELEKAFNMDTDGKLEPGGGGAPSFEKPILDGEILKNVLLDIKAKMLEMSAIDLKDMLKMSPEAEKSMTGAALKMQQIKMDTLSAEEAQQQQLNNLMLSGAQNMTQIMLRGGKDWEEQMFLAIIKLGIQMGLNMVVPGLGSIVSGFLPFQFGGVVRGAQHGTIVPDSGLYGDRHPYMLERGEIVIPRQEAVQSGGGRSSSVSISLSMGSMFSSASRTELLKSADIIVQALRERGVSVG